MQIVRHGVAGVDNPLEWSLLRGSREKPAPQFLHAMAGLAAGPAPAIASPY
jgi:hypothetical protein